MWSVAGRRRAPVRGRACCGLVASQARLSNTLQSGVLALSVRLGSGGPSSPAEGGALLQLSAWSCAASLLLGICWCSAPGQVRHGCACGRAWPWRQLGPGPRRPHCRPALARAASAAALEVSLPVAVLPRVHRSSCETCPVQITVWFVSRLEPVDTLGNKKNERVD